VYRRILVPLDGTAAAERVLPYVVPLAERFGASLTLLEATPTPADVAAAEAAVGAIPVSPPLVDPDQVAGAEQAGAADYLGRLVDRLRGRGFPVERALAQGPAADAIVAHAERVGADLIAMATHGRSGLGRLLLGSVADQVVRHAPCPVLLVRIHDEPAAGAEAATSHAGAGPAPPG
jgi:nucleotide-binding universal stress UspA family protein